MAGMTVVDRCKKYNEAVALYNHVILRGRGCVGNTNYSQTAYHCIPEIKIVSVDDEEYAPDQIIDSVSQSGCQITIDIANDTALADGIADSRLIVKLRELASRLELMVAKPHGPWNKRFPNGYLQLYDADDNTNGIGVWFHDNVCLDLDHLDPPPSDHLEFNVNKHEGIWATYDPEEEASMVEDAVDVIASIASHPTKISHPDYTFENFRHVFEINFSTDRTTLTRSDVKSKLKSAYTTILNKLDNAFNNWVQDMAYSIDLSAIVYERDFQTYGYTEYLRVVDNGVTYTENNPIINFSIPSNNPEIKHHFSYTLPTANYTVGGNEDLYWIHPDRMVAEIAPYSDPDYDFTDTNIFWTAGTTYCSGGSIRNLKIEIGLWKNHCINPVTVESGVTESAEGNVTIRFTDSPELVVPLTEEKNPVIENGRFHYMQFSTPSFIAYTIPPCSMVPAFTVYEQDLNKISDIFPEYPEVEETSESNRVIRELHGWYHGQKNNVIVDDTTYDTNVDSIQVVPETHDFYGGYGVELVYDPPTNQ